MVGLEVESDTDDSYSLSSSRTSVLSKSRKFDHRPSSTQCKDVASDVDDIDKMKVLHVSHVLL